MTANLAQVATQQKQVPQAALQLEKNTPETKDRFAKQGRQFRENRRATPATRWTARAGSNHRNRGSLDQRKSDHEKTSPAMHVRKSAAARFACPSYNPSRMSPLRAARRFLQWAAMSQEPRPWCLISLALIRQIPRVLFLGSIKVRIHPQENRHEIPMPTFQPIGIPTNLARLFHRHQPPRGSVSGVVGGGVDTGVAPVDVLIPAAT